MECPTCGDYSGSRDSVARHHGRSHSDEWEDRFWMYVDRRGEDECWLWEGQRHYLQGHGRFKREGDYYYAHRVAYRLECGEISGQINHSCENPPCVNPNHLYDGTQKENMEDASESDSFNPLRGADVEVSKLTESQVVEMRERYVGGETQTELSEDYPVNQAMVSRIVRGVAWSHVPGPTTG